MIRYYCDRCDRDVTDEKTGAIGGIADANQEGDGTTLPVLFLDA